MAGADVENVLLTLEPSVAIPGRVSMDPASGKTLAQLSGTVRFRSFLYPSVNGIRIPGIVGAIGGAPFPDSDCAFALTNVPPGEYRLSFPALADAYVKEAQYRGADVLNAPLNISSTEPGELVIVLSTNMGRASGTVRESRGQPASGATVVLIPDESSRTDLYRTATTNEIGAFTIPEVASGNYKLYSWEAMEPYSYFDPVFVSRFSAHARPIRVAESSTVAEQLSLIPSQ